MIQRNGWMMAARIVRATHDVQVVVAERPTVEQLQTIIDNLEALVAELRATPKESKD
jgi:hypothetical protein